MRQLEKVLRSLRSLFRRRQDERQMNEELQFHLERQIEHNLAAGMSPEEAATLRCEPSEALARPKRRHALASSFISSLLFGLRGY